MSSTLCVKLTDEQQKFLNSLEEEFKDRYTDNDKEFKAVLNEELPLPPIMENWRDSNNRNDTDHDRNRDRASYDRRRYYHNYDDDYRYSHSSRYNNIYRDRNCYRNTNRPY